jgi:RecA-family ATPase
MTSTAGVLMCVPQVTDWLDYVLGKCDQPPSFMRRKGVFYNPRITANVLRIDY